MDTSLQESVKRQRESLTQMLTEPLSRLAAQCATVWGQRDRLDRVLMRGLSYISYCTFLYALNVRGIQISDNASRDGLLSVYFGRDRSQRPYMKEAVPAKSFLLSEAYISSNARRPSLTALQVVHQGSTVLGFVGADFDLRNLPLTAELYEAPGHWRQVKGDPAIRDTVFLQTRVESAMDRQIDQALSIIEELMVERGVFHTVIHFSSSRATLWWIDDPYRYRILEHDALDDPDVCLAYPLRAYPGDAVFPADAVRPTLEAMRRLRFADETIYLRSSSLNLFNGMISLTFSCDGSHYMRYDEFVAKGMDFWVGWAA